VSHSLPPDVAEALRYLQDIGYGDLYLPRGEKQETRNADATRLGSESDPVPPAKVNREISRSTGRPGQGAPADLPPKKTSPPVPESSGGRSGETPEAARLPVVGPPAAERRQALEVVASEAEGCLACPLSKGRQKVVFGSGHPNAELMLIGEGPGAEEDRQGLPFVGPAGELLTKILKAIEIERSEVYIANVVKCRPPNNRDPERDEVAACRSYLERQIDLVQPRAIVALGRVAAQALLGTTEALGRLRGRWHSVQGVPTRTTYHPAALLRYSHYKRPTWEDMQVVRDYLQQAGG